MTIFTMYKHRVADGKEEKTMSKRIMTFALLSLFLVGVTPAYSQTYEQATKVQVERALSSKDGAKIKESVNKYSEKYNVEPALIHAVILTESGFNKNARSSHGANGLMQLMPVTFKARKVGTNPFDIEQNIHAGVKHLAGLLGRYKGDVYLALAAYNMGGGALDSYKGRIPSYGKRYVNRVLYNKGIIENIQL